MASMARVSFLVLTCYWALSAALTAAPGAQAPAAPQALTTAWSVTGMPTWGGGAGVAAACGVAGAWVPGAAVRAALSAQQQVRTRNETRAIDAMG